MPPPKPAVAAIRQNTQYGVAGSCTATANSSVGTSSSSGADHRPVAAAERRHRERVGQPQQRADQVRQRDQQEQLLRGEVEAHRSRNAALTLQISQTEKPRCSAKIDQTRLRRATWLPPCLPELLVLGTPVVDPAPRAASGRGRGGRRVGRSRGRVMRACNAADVSPGAGRRDRRRQLVLTTSQARVAGRGSRGPEAGCDPRISGDRRVVPVATLTSAGNPTKVGRTPTTRRADRPLSDDWRPLTERSSRPLPVVPVTARPDAGHTRDQSLRTEGHRGGRHPGRGARPSLPPRPGLRPAPRDRRVHRAAAPLPGVRLPGHGRVPGLVPALRRACPTGPATS